MAKNLAKNPVKSVKKSVKKVQTKTSTKTPVKKSTKIQKISINSAIDSKSKEQEAKKIKYVFDRRDAIAVGIAVLVVLLFNFIF